MKHIFHTIQHTARAATVLLLALLAAQTAGAQENIRQVSNALNLVEAFNDPTVSVVNVTDNITVVGGLEPVNGNRNLTINLNGNTISGDYLSFNVEPDGTLTINGGGQGGSVGNIISGYAYWSAIDNLGTVTLRNVNITTNYDFAITGTGMLYIGNSVSFNGWTGMPFDTPNFNFEGGNYSGTVVATVTVGGQTHYFENSDAALAYIVSHPDNDHFSLSGTTYTIHTATGWDAFCYLLENGETFSGKTVELANDITVTRCAGSGAGSDLTASDRPFCGTFDGQGNTLTFNYGTSDTPADENNIAPFRYVNNATIQHLHVVGDIYTQHVHAGGIVGMAYGTTNITDCRSSVNIISSITGDGTHGGIMSCSWTGSTTSITGCLFDGSIQSASGYTTNQCGGFVGWRNATINVSNSLLTADLSTIDTPDGLTYPSATFVRNGNNNTITNCYYTEPFGTAQGKALHTVTAGTDVTVAHAGVATHYATSGITAYKATGASADSDPFIAGLLYNNNVVDVLYAGIDDVVSLTLSNTATGAPDGYQYAGYTTNAGTLEGSTLTMPDQDVTISVNTEVLTAIPWSGDGTEGSPYIIKYASQLDLLAHRVNGTHDETANDYYNTYFKLNNDISYPHTSDWDDAECEQESNYEAIGGRYDYNDRYFRGHFDGNNKTISGIRIYKGDNSGADNYQGIFGRTNGADIHDLTLADARITGYDYTGGIVGYNNGGTVTRCHVAGDVAVCAVQSGAWYHGGIVGEKHGGTIEQCTSAVTLTTADADNSGCYGGIAGYNNGGTLRDNLAIGATVPAAKNNYNGAITGKNIGGSLLRNYYAACKVADTENATGVGCGCIDDGNGGRTTADVTTDNGAVSIHTLTLADGITTSTAATVTIGTTGYYAQGTTIALSYSGAPDGYSFNGYTVSGGTLEGSTLTMPDQDVTVSLALRSTGKPVEEVSYVDAGGTARTHDAVALDGTETGLGTDDEETWYFVGLPTVAFDHTLYLNGNVHLILADGCTMNVTSDGYGIYVYGSLTIYGQTDGTGALNATGDSYGIYTSYNASITISGGTVTVTGNNYGISTNGGYITISGGRVTATGGIGFGIHSGSGDITISGGRVTATGGIGIFTNSGTITLGCTTASDFIYASSYDAGSEDRLNIADGQTLYDEDGNYYSGTNIDYADLNGKTLRLYGIALAAREAPDLNYWTTYYNGTQGFTIDKNEHACAYTATYGDGKLTLHNLGKQIPAGTAVIIVADNDEVSMTAADLDAYTGANDLHGVDVDTDVADITSALGTGTLYVLGMTTIDDEQHFGFHRYTGTTMAAHKAFVHVSGSPEARSLTMVFDEATGIVSAEANSSLFTLHSSLSTWFTLDGRRLQAKPTAPGIYVNNGRKVVIK